MKRTALLLFLAFGVVCFAQAPRPPVDKLSQLTDVHLTSPTNTQVLTYDSGTSKWINAAGGGGGTSLFTALDFTNSQTIPMYLKAPLHLHSTGDSSNPAAHPYTMLTTGIYVTDANNAEVFRLWASDPDVTDNFNSGNLYIGALAGEAQPSDNTSAGYNNTGVGYHALKAITTGTVNSVFGSLALEKNTTGSSNTVVGEGSLQENTDGAANTAIGYNVAPGFFQHLNETVLIGANATTGSDSLTNAIAIGSTASVAASNTAVIGNSSVTDVYFGSTSGTAILHGTGTGITGLTPSLVGLGNVTNDTQAKASTTLTIGPTTFDLSTNRTFIANVTNDTQTKASIVPNTVPGAGKILIGNGTAYDLKTISGTVNADVTLAFSGAVDIANVQNSALVNNSINIAGTATSLGGTATRDAIIGISSNGFVKRTGTNTYTNDTSTYLTGNQTITLSGDVTGSGATAITTTNVNLPDGVTQAGSLVLTDIAAPSSPAAGHLKVFGDSTDLRFHDKNAAGTIGTTVVADTGASNNFLTAISASGVISKAQPSYSNISGTDAPAIANVTGLATGVATFLGTSSSANLATAVTDETGSGALVFGTSPTITTPVIASGLTASGSGSNNFSGSTGAFQTSSGANTVNGVLTITPPVRTSGVASYLTLNIPADTGQTASTESIGYQHVTATRTWADGTVALQRENFFAGPTYNKTTTSATFTDPFTVYITPPVAGSGVTFTRGHSLGIVDSTSASSSITGGLVVSTTVGTTATSVGIGGGNINAGGTLTVGGHDTLEGVTSTGATGTGKHVYDTSPTLVTPLLGTPTSGVMTNVTGTADGLTAGDVTRNHAVYAGASPPTVDVGAFTISKTGVDLKGAATTTVFTVPTSRGFVCTGSYAVVTSVTSGGAGTTTFQIKESSASRVMTAGVASASVTPVANQSVYLEMIPNAAAYTVLTTCEAGNSVQVVVSTSNAGSTAVSGTVFVQGFYYK